MGPGKRGRGVAFVLSGLTIANVIGVPAITFLGQQAGWRAAYLAVAVVFALAVLAICSSCRAARRSARDRARANSAASSASRSGSRC